METLRRNRESIFTAPLLGLWSAAVALAPGWQTKALLLSPIVLALIWWIVLRPQRWLALFFVCLLLTPPFPGPIGDAGLHIAPLIALIGILAGAFRLQEWRVSLSALSAALGAFLAILLSGAAFAAIYSGQSVAFGSLLRTCLFGIGIYVFFYVSAGPGRSGANSRRFAAFLFLIACTAALFACADFYFQFPAPAGFEAQYVWLAEGVFRRAQGLFYEASTLGNFCAFFLVMIAVALFRRDRSPLPRPALGLGGAIFGTALILSYSRASVINVLAALVALAILRGSGGARFWRIAPATLLIAAAAVVAVHFALPSFSASYWTRLANSLTYFRDSPNGVLSGRLNNWLALIGFLTSNPWHALFGVGYKTLAYSGFTGSRTVADNTYLSMLVETGIAGFTAFLILNAAILRYAYRAARSTRPQAAFFGEWMFCFWIGQMAQMFSGDLMTYWRVLPVYFWVLATAVRETEPGS